MSRKATSCRKKMKPASTEELAAFRNVIKHIEHLLGRPMDMESRSREEHIVWPRAVLCYLMQYQCGFTQEKIQACFGYKINRSTVTHRIQMVTRVMSIGETIEGICRRYGRPGHRIDEEDRVNLSIAA